MLQLLEFVQETPMVMVFVASFGLFFGGIIVTALGIFVLQRLHLRLPSAWLRWLGIYFILLFLLGFLSQIVLGLSGISGLHLLAIWLATALVVALFCITQAGQLLRLWEQVEDVGKMAARAVQDQAAETEAGS